MTQRIKPNTLTGIKGTLGAVKPGSPPIVFQRDLVYAFPIIFKNATILTENAYTEDMQMSKKDYMEVLDTISQFYIRLWSEARKDNVLGLSMLNEIHSYLQEDKTGQRSSVYAAYNSFVVSCLFAYMFGSKSMSVASPDTIDDECFSIDMFFTLLGMMSDEDRQIITKSIRKNAVLNPAVKLNSFFNESKTFLEEIRKDQEERYAAENK